MKIIEYWIDKKLTPLVADREGFIILTDEDVEELKVLLGIHQGAHFRFTEMAARDYIYYLVDQHRDYFQEKMEEFSNEYAQQQTETNRVMQSCQ